MQILEILSMPMGMTALVPLLGATGVSSALLLAPVGAVGGALALVPAGAAAGVVGALAVVPEAPPDLSPLDDKAVPSAEATVSY